MITQRSIAGQGCFARIASAVILVSFASTHVVFAAETVAEKSTKNLGARIAPPNLSPRVSSEYFSADPDNRIQIPVNVWGAVREPGLHFMPLGSSLTEAIGASGGPAVESASLPYVTLIRNKQEREVNILKEGIDLGLVRNDTIIIETSFKKDLPLYFSGISMVITIVTFVLVLRK